MRMRPKLYLINLDRAEFRLSSLLVLLQFMRMRPKPYLRNPDRDEFRLSSIEQRRPFLQRSYCLKSSIEQKKTNLIIKLLWITIKSSLSNPIKGFPIISSLHPKLFSDIKDNLIFFKTHY